jgi:PAS domain S-box-containing protein
VSPRLDPSSADPAALWQAVCDTSTDFVAVVDRECIIRFCNRVDDGFRMEDVVGHDICRFTVAESSGRLRDAVREVFETGEPRDVETMVRRLDGTLNFFSLRLGPVAGPEGVAAVLACCRSTLPMRTVQQTLEHERHVLRKLLEIQERERQLVSYEIHDGLSQYLAGALMHLQAFEHSVPQPPGPEFAECMRLLGSAVEESRRLIAGLRPPALDELGVVEAVESLVNEARADIPSVGLVEELGRSRLPAPVETTIFRIVQEALTNARKHAAARSAQVSLTRTPGAVRVSIRDDGTGFDPGSVPADRFGLEGIRQRARLLGAEPMISSRPGQGTTIEVVLPVPDDTR